MERKLSANTVSMVVAPQKLLVTIWQQQQRQAFESQFQQQWVCRHCCVCRLEDCPYVQQQ